MVDDKFPDILFKRPFGSNDLIRKSGDGSAKLKRPFGVDPYFIGGCVLFFRQGIFQVIAVEIQSISRCQW